MASNKRLKRILVALLIAYLLVGTVSVGPLVTLAILGVALGALVGLALILAWVGIILAYLYWLYLYKGEATFYRWF